MPIKPSFDPYKKIRKFSVWFASLRQRMNLYTGRVEKNPWTVRPLLWPLSAKTGCVSLMKSRSSSMTLSLRRPRYIKHASGVNLESARSSKSCQYQLTPESIFSGIVLVPLSTVDSENASLLHSFLCDISVWFSEYCKKYDISKLLLKPESYQDWAVSLSVTTRRHRLHLCTVVCSVSFLPLFVHILLLTFSAFETAICAAALFLQTFPNYFSYGVCSFWSSYTLQVLCSTLSHKFFCDACQITLDVPNKNFKFILSIVL